MSRLKTKRKITLRQTIRKSKAISRPDTDVIRNYVGTYNATCCMCSAPNARYFCHIKRELSYVDQIITTC